jgi:TolB-like protein
MLRPFLVAFAAVLVALGGSSASAAQPVLVVYPFAVNGATPDGLGAQISDHVAAEMIALGGVTIVRGAVGAKPADYRTQARAAGAEVYYSGSIVPVGARYSAIEQLVSTHSGLILWSTTMQFQSADDVTGEGARIRAELLRGTTPPPAPQQPVQPTP